MNYYVYHHIDPRTDEIVYVGYGCRERAWVIRARSDEHRGWCENLMDEGFVPSDWVHIIYKNINKKFALELELTLIHQFRPKFNKNFNNSGKVTEADLENFIWLRTGGLSFVQIAEITGFATMTVHRALAGKTKGLSNFANELL